MIVLALVCLVAAAAMVLLMLTAGFTSTVVLETFAGDLQTRAFWVFVAGALTLLLAEAAVAMLRTGTRRKVERRRELKRLRRIEEQAGTRNPDVAEERERFERGEHYSRPRRDSGDTQDIQVPRGEQHDRVVARDPGVPHDPAGEQPGHRAP